ncbi:MAG: GTPase family protein [Microcystaceae cyanobacterium]
MIRLKAWQWSLLSLPPILIVGFMITAAGWQIHQWGIDWIWAVIIVMLAGWRSLLARWLRPSTDSLRSLDTQLNDSTPLSSETTSNSQFEQAEAAFYRLLQQAQQDQPIWQDWDTFWQRCRTVVTEVARVYHPEVKYPLLNIYIPQAYGLIRGTTEDVDRWMAQLSPALNQVTVGQAYQTYQTYQKIEPSARKLLQIWNWAQWVINPTVAAAKLGSKGYASKANQQLLTHFSQMIREVALKNLFQQAIALYSGDTLPDTFNPLDSPSLPKAKTETIRDIVAKTEPIAKIEQKPVSILLFGRTGAGKSSLINTLFRADKAEVDVLPSTDQIQSYHWLAQNQETLTLWDTPGYEQINQGELRDLVLDYAVKADLILLLTPALDPALQMDVECLEILQAEAEDLPIITLVTQVDRLRPIREWNPPYNWQEGTLAKEIAIREATQYRSEQLGAFSNLILPIVTADTPRNRQAWNEDQLSIALIEALEPTKKLRLARFLRNLDSRINAAAQIIDRYTFQMTTTQGLTNFLKSPVLQFLSTLSTGTPALAYALAQQIPVEQLPLVIGKLQMAYSLFPLFNEEDEKNLSFELMTLWPLLLENPGSPEQNAWAFGHALIEYWSQGLTVDQFRQRFTFWQEQTIKL